MHMGYPEEGDKCPTKDCNRTLAYPKVEGCSCHINPPCSACVDNLLACPECKWEEDERED